MRLRLSRTARIALFSGLALLTALSVAVYVATGAAPNAHAASTHFRIHCEDDAALCTEVLDSLNYEGQYTGHDEPSLLFYSNVPGSGNSDLYRLTLPRDAAIAPKQDGTGGTFNFQLHPAFWFGMAMCDTQSAPNPGVITTCAPDSDTNIADSANPHSANYIGNHPGTAFMEMQFYPPGWVAKPFGVSCDATRWCAALTIDSLTENLVTGQINNAACLADAGPEPVNFAFITTSGVPQPGSPPNPVDSTLQTFTPDPSADLFMSSGDTLTVDMHDTAHGLQVIIHDLTAGTTGSMTASAANDFGQVKWDPNGTTCQAIPSDYHPMYSTATEHTRVPWAAHSYNIAFSDEIGHFEYCNASSGFDGHCVQDGVHDLDTTFSGHEDDNLCFNPSDSLSVPIGGCTLSDADFDGPEYLPTWPGSGADPAKTAAPIVFSSPLFTGPGNSGLRNYQRAAFETDLPRVENDTTPPCQRHLLNPSDPNPGQGCVNPAAGSTFYPIFTTTNAGGACLWQEGGGSIPGTTNNFGGTSTAEYGDLIPLVYPDPNPTGFTVRLNDFRNVLRHNPCPA